MEERIFLVTNINKSCIKAGHHFFYLTQVYVAHCERKIAAFLMQFNKLVVVQERNIYIRRTNVDDQVLTHVTSNNALPRGMLKHNKPKKL